MRTILHVAFFLLLTIFISCNSHKNSSNSESDSDALQSVIMSTDSLKTFPFIEKRVEEIKQALQQPIPVLLCRDSLNESQKKAELIAIRDSAFTEKVRNAETKMPYRCEIFGVYPARESDMSYVKVSYELSNCYRVDLYNYALNQSSSAIVDIHQGKVLATSLQTQTQPDIPEELKRLAIKIAVESPEVQQALGVKPNEKDILYTRIKTALNRSRCERSKHLCVSPTFVQKDKALWAIVDLTDYKLVGLRWTNVGETGPATVITERKLQDDKITACYCERETELVKDDWKLSYMLTNSDGLRISQVSYKGRPVLQSAKLVDWHVSYSRTDGFGYSDAVGCPYFSQAAVVAIFTPKVAELYDDNNNLVGFSLEQTFRMDAFPAPCNYQYFQRYDFYKDGRFRIAGANMGRGCGNDGTYRPVFRIAFAAEQNNFAEWNGKDWNQWTKEKWQLQGPTTLYTPQGYQYKITDNMGMGYYLEPSRGQFHDGGRGDNAYVYTTVNRKDIDEGESDMVTIGPCCNTDYHQGPEKFIEPNPENIQNQKLVVWYVAQLKNDDTKGREYCWSESVLVNGVYKTKTYPCFCGPMFTPIK
jgi:hypothetical protein